MESAKNARLNVDEETRELLTELSEAMRDSWDTISKDLIKRDEMEGHIRKLETHVSGALETTADKLCEAFETGKKRLEQVLSKLESQTAATEQAIAQLTSQVAKTELNLQTRITSNHDQLQQCVSLLESLIIPVNAIKADTAQLKVAANNFTDRFGTLEGRMSALLDQLTTLNRPWWRKILE